VGILLETGIYLLVDGLVEQKAVGLLEGVG
jgi:hypothetical protein